MTCPMTHHQGWALSSRHQHEQTDKVAATVLSSIKRERLFCRQLRERKRERDNVVYWKTKRKIHDDRQLKETA